MRKRGKMVKSGAGSMAVEIEPGLWRLGVMRVEGGCRKATRPQDRVERPRRRMSVVGGSSERDRGRFLAGRWVEVWVVVDDGGDGKAGEVLSAGEVWRDLVTVGAPDGGAEMVEENEEGDGFLWGPAGGEREGDVGGLHVGFRVAQGGW
jgi:hypothetical protein